LDEEAGLRAGHDGVYGSAASLAGLSPGESAQGKGEPPAPALPPSESAEREIHGSLMAAIEQETDRATRQLLKNAAGTIAGLMAELQGYRDAAEYDFSRPKSMQFRGWDMGKLQKALNRTRENRA
jgi:hypothetical protein